MIKKRLLDNGLRVVFEKITDVRSVAIGIWVYTGSRNESYDINGISHFIEHLLFKGTANRDAKGIAETIDAIGGQLNAFTSKEYTCFYTRVRDEHAEIGLNLLSDMLFNSLFVQKEVDRERKVVLEEINMYEDTPDDQVHDLISAAAFNDNSLGYSILGRADSLNSLSRDSILKYMGDNYNLSNIVIAIAGNIDDNLIALVNKYFGGFNNVGKENLLVPAKFTGNKILKTKETEQVHLALAFPGFAANSDTLYALNLLNNLFGGSMSSLLFQEVREKLGLAYSVYSYHSAFREIGQFTIYAGTNPQNLEQLIEVLFRVIRKNLVEDITEADIVKGKEQLKGGLMLGLESTSNRMHRLGKNELYLEKHLTIDEIIQKIDSITLEDFNQVIELLFTGNYSAAVIGPISELPAILRSESIVNN
jgi:predicted Zn-dependent peptidase